LKKFLIIQTAFIGDVILATPLIEKLHDYYKDAEIDFLLRKGNETLFENHPKLNQVLIWDKKNGKYKNLFKLISQIRKQEYDLVINIQRFASTGFLTWLSKAKLKVGFEQNPFSFCYNNKYKVFFDEGKHETERNLELLADYGDIVYFKPKLYPTEHNYKNISEYISDEFVTIAPASVWYTKQFHKSKWIELINKLADTKIILIGAPSDTSFCEEIISKSEHKNIINLAGKLSFLDSAELMKHAKMNYVNDSAPMHLASAVNAPTTAVYCSTVTDFGFGPLSDNSKIIEIESTLDCRPCGLHGKKSCPEGHFDCAMKIDVDKMLF